MDLVWSGVVIGVIMALFLMLYDSVISSKAKGGNG